MSSSNQSNSCAASDQTSQEGSASQNTAVQNTNEVQDTNKVQLENDSRLLEAFDHSKIDTLEASAATASFMMAPFDYNDFPKISAKVHPQAPIDFSMPIQVYEGGEEASADCQQVMEPLDLGRGFPTSQEDRASQNASEVDNGQAKDNTPNKTSEGSQETTSTSMATFMRPATVAEIGDLNLNAFSGSSGCNVQAEGSTPNETTEGSQG